MKKTYTSNTATAEGSTLLTTSPPEKYISYIPRTDFKQFALKKVAVYSRVSREGEVKHHSITMQKEHLEQYVLGHPNWVFTRHYVDEGKTGTKFNRPAFNEMMADARAGKIDIILTKTVSRFGRNMQAVLETIHELKDLDVTVIFDNEGLRTDNPDAIFQLHYLAIQAEVESKQTSDYQKWAIRNRFKKGIPTYIRLYGYEMEEHILKVVPEEAKVVKRIYKMYLSGMGLEAITKRLNQDGIPSPHGTRWRKATIYYILRDEKYTGDLLLQKTFRKDYLTKKRINNHGELPQYLVLGAHEKIIDKATFEKTQKEIIRREEINHQIVINTKSPSDHIDASEPRPFTGLIQCSHCNAKFIYKAVRNSKIKRELWVCNDYLAYGKKHCSNKAIPEGILMDATREVLYSHHLIKKDKDGKFPELTHNLLTSLITKIIAHEDMTLEYHLADGEIVMKTWQFKSRRESWTPEMRALARKRALDNIAKKKKTEGGSNGQ